MLALAFALVATCLALAAGSALAGQTRLYTGTSFGPDGVAGSESFSNVQSIAVDQFTGDIYVLDYGAEKVYKFDSAGEPLDFSSTGTSSFEPKVNLPFLDGESEIAIAPTGSPGGTAGDIYVTSRVGVSVYAPSGQKLGELGTEACGVTTDPAGNLFIAEYKVGKVGEYVPSTNPPTDGDLSQPGANDSLQSLCDLAVDGAGDIYAANWAGHGVYKLEGVGDTTPTKIDPVAQTIAVDPATEDLYADQRERVATYSSSGAFLGTFGGGQLTNSFGVAVGDAASRVYVSDGDKVKVFGTPVPVPTVALAEALTPTPSQATLRGSVNPEGLAVTECFFEYGTSEAYGHTTACEALPPTNSEPDAVTAAVSGLETDGVTYHFRLVAANANGSESSSDQTLTTAPTVLSEPAGVVGETTAALHGKTYPDGIQYSICEFEYGLTSHPGFETSAACAPTAGEIPSDYSFHAVAAALTGLHANDTTYRFRLKATNAHGTVYGKTLTFTTTGEPQLSEVRATDADQDSATLEATINPSGFATSYQIEWGPTSSYGQTATAGSLESTAGPTRISAHIAGLSASTIYHYRIVATNQIGTAISLDHEIETLDACGLPQGRCFELVSPPDAGPIATPGKGLYQEEVSFQAALAPGALAYYSEGGLPGATRGGEVLYKAVRGSAGWTSSQLSAPITVRDERQGESSDSSRTLGLSPDLSCGVLESTQPLTADPGTRLVLEDGGANLYRHNPDGSYTAITAVPPENPEEQYETSFTVYFHLDGISNDCSRIFFTSVYHYPGTHAVGTTWLYEWDEGALRSVGIVPGGGEVPVQAIAGGKSPDSLNDQADLHAVSEDGRRVFFSAERKIGNNPGEAGTTGVFVRENGASTVDLSLSETSVPDKGATYQDATADGSRVYFTANAGLTKESSSEGVDLYEYDLEKSPSEHPLTDLSIEHGEGTAEAAGVVGTSEDGSRVYFAAGGQLIPGRGLSAAENHSQRTYSLYTELAGHVAFVATVGHATGNDEGENLLTDEAAKLTSRVSPDGRYLLFESVTPVTSYESGGAREAYLYDAAAASETITCISCRPDGHVSAAQSSYHPLRSAYEDLAVHTSPPEPFVPPRSLTVMGGRPSVLFYSIDPLAPGATEGQTGLYEWSHGQVFLITAEPPEMQSPDIPAGTERFVLSLGADADGSDLYLATPKSLTWEDGDERFSVYDARVGGGFPEPAAAAPPCDPTSEGSCQGASSEPPASVEAASATFAGSGNLVVPLVPTATPAKPRLTRVQQLAKALRACRSYKAKARRVSCEKRARSKYGPVHKAKAKTHTKAKSRKAKSRKGGK